MGCSADCVSGDMRSRKSTSTTWIWICDWLLFVSAALTIEWQPELDDARRNVLMHSLDLLLEDDWFTAFVRIMWEEWIRTFSCLVLLDWCSKFVVTLSIIVRDPEKHGYIISVACLKVSNYLCPSLQEVDFKPTYTYFCQVIHLLGFVSWLKASVNMNSI